MNQPTIVFEGEEYPIHSVYWMEGKLDSVCFTSGDQHFTAFHYEKEEGRVSPGILRLNLNERVKWGVLERVE